MDRHCSILLPSRGDLGLLANMLTTLAEKTAEPDGVELVIRLDDDDPDLGRRIGIIEETIGLIPTRVLVGARSPMGAMTVQMGRAATGRTIWLMNDDIVHETYGWDRLVRAVTAERPGHVFFPDDSMFSPELACFPLLPKAHVDATDFYGIGRYERYLIDCVISDLYSFTLDRLVYLPQWKIRHLNDRPTSATDGSRWARKVRGTDRAYQPADESALARDQARYVEHVRGVKAMAAQIEAVEASWTVSTH